MNPDLLNPLIRKEVIEGIKSWENIIRKRESLKAYEIFNDRLFQYVNEELARQLSKKTADSMPIIATLNIAKRVVDNKASIYADEPTRKYTDISTSDEDVLAKIYKECGFNTSLQKSNKYFTLRNQAFINVVPKQGKLKLRVLHGHNIDVIPDADDPELAYAYIVSSFDKTAQVKSDGANQITADVDDYRKSLEKYQVWTAEYSFIMNGNGQVVSEITPNPIRMLPFIDIAKEKDFEFFVRMGQSITDFTIDFNVAWSDLMYISRLQGYNIGVLSGDPALKPDDLTVGPNKMMFLPANPAQPDSNLKFEFKSPTPNIEASLKAIDSLVATFMTTRGADANGVSSNNSSAKTYSSAIERLLAMIDQFRATKEDFDLFKVVEEKLHTILTAWLSVLSGTELLEPDMWVQQNITASTLSVIFQKPEMIETTAEKLDNAKKKVDLGIADRVSVLMDIGQMSEDDAVAEIEEIDLRKQARLQVLMAQMPNTPLDPNGNPLPVAPSLPVDPNAKPNTNPQGPNGKA